MDDGFGNFSIIGTINIKVFRIGVIRIINIINIVVIIMDIGTSAGWFVCNIERYSINRIFRFI